ncbi:MAG: class I SAM-dependent methyltransferase [Candidatus Hydrogenedentes bacterium]|nr:class I SAM-dependent methyltransferase [Candidatus Hydrogenedentota bacterium]
MQPENILNIARKSLAGMDIYLLDLVLSGKLIPPMRVLDAGCGAGRNLAVLGSLGFDVVGLDRSAQALSDARRQAPGAPILRARLDALPWATPTFDVVVANAVLHFASNPDEFDGMLAELWRLLLPGGILFARLAVIDGMEAQASPRANGQYGLPDGTVRFLSSLDNLELRTRTLGGSLVIPLKTALVHRQRSMATWCLRKE